jgi:hypothetical protein
MKARIFFAFVICWPGTIVFNQGNTGGIKYQPAAEQAIQRLLQEIEICMPRR